MPKAKKRKAASAPKTASQQTLPSPFKKPLPLIVSGLFLLLFAAFMATTITFPAYSWENPFHYQWNFGYASWQCAFFLMVLLFMAAWYLREQKASVPDVPVGWARFGFLTLLASAFFLTTYRQGIPINNYAEDTALNMYLPIHLRDTSDFRGTFILNYGVLPLWPYTAWLLYHLLPGAHALVIQRLTGAFFDLGTLFVLYHIGKDLAGRRVGLYCAAMGLLGKALLYKVVSGFNYSTTPFAVACVLWATLRLGRKEASDRFIVWGALIGMAACSSFPIQPVLLVFIFSSLALLWWEDRKEMSWAKTGPWIWVSLPFFILYAVFCIGCLPLDHWLVDGYYRIYQPNVSLGLVIVGILVAGAYHFKWIMPKRDNIWNQWLVGAWLAVFFSFPALTHWNILDRIREHGLANNGYETDYLSFGYFAKALPHFPDTLRALFLGMMDPPDTSLGGDAFFSYSEAVLIGLGLVFCLAKPNLKRTFVLFMALVGLAPYFFAGLNHSGLLLCCLAPFWLIAAVGLEELTQLCLGWPWGRYAWPVVLGALLVFGGWSVRQLSDRVYHQWAYPYWDNLEFRTSAIADMDMPGQRVYLSQQLNFWRRGYFNFDGHTFYAWNEMENTLYLSPGEPVPNVVIYFNGYDDPGVEKRLRAAFPEAHWEMLGSPLVTLGTFAYRCEIPAALIEKKRNPQLMVQTVPSDHWERTWGINGFGINFSGISWQDEVVHPMDKPEPKYPICNFFDDIALRVRAKVHISQTGRYTFECYTGNRTLFWIDHQKVFDLTFIKLWDYMASPDTSREKIDLEKGDHEVELITYMQSSGSFAFPKVTVKAPGAAQAVSLWEGFTF